MWLFWGLHLCMLMSCRRSLAQLVRCDMPADVVFLLDASDSIEPMQWEQEKDFVGILVDSLAVERHAINVGLIVYSTEIGQVVDLQPFKTKQQLHVILPTLLQTSQGTDTARAINRMRQMMQNQARDGAKRIAVVITDGRSENSTATIQEAVYARQLDRVMMIALGVGNETYIDELQEIAKSDYYPNRNRLFTVRDFAQLQGVVEELRKLICEAIPITTPTTTTSTTTTTITPIITAPDLPPISCPRPADVVFLLDGSFSITAGDWAVGRVFVSALVQSLSVDIDAIHAGIIVYSSDIGDTVPLKPFQDKVALQKKASGLRQPQLGRTNTALGIRELRNMFSQQGRRGVPHVGIVITDGKSSNVQNTIDEARLAKTVDRIAMLVVGVGQDTLDTELRAMASSPETLFNVTGFSALFDIAEALTGIICIVIDESTTTVTTTTARTTPPTPVIPDLCKECLVEGGVGYNSYPPSCTQYSVCYPESNGGYRAVVKDCPFGLFWSSDAVSCVDSAYVNCSTDPCKGRPDGWGHSGGTKGCSEYWVCRGDRSLPQCCPVGQSYLATAGCDNDSGCRDRCSLKFTVAGSGTCPFRPSRENPFSYVEVTPGRGSVERPCAPGTVYSQEQCGCVFNTPSLGCIPSLHYSFDGSFDDRSKYRHTALVDRVLLTKNSTAYFNSTGRLQVDSLPSSEFKDSFALHIRYRVQPEDTPNPNLQWNDNYQWGLQEWFATNQPLNFTYSGGHQTLPEPPGPDPALPSGQATSTLERVVILRNGSVLHADTGSADPGAWPSAGSGTFVSRVHLGPMAGTTETAVSGGVVYVPNSQDQILLMYPKTASSPARWQIVSKDGQPLHSGAGQIPEATAASFKFQLRPQPTTRWFIMTASGTVLKSGTGDIPESVKNLYAGYATGKLLKVDQIGEEVVQWTTSRPDGSEATSGRGSIPVYLRQDLKLDEVLKPPEAMVSRWAVLGDTGDVLQTGTGSVPLEVFKNYEGLGSGLVLTNSEAGHWLLQRTDGSRLLEGQSPLPSSLSAYIRGSFVLPGYTEKSSWSVLLPNGTRLSGDGPVPDHIRKLFEQPVAEPGGSDPAVLSRWYVTDAAGAMLASGYGEVPQTLLQRYGGSAGATVVQQLGGRGLNSTRWEVRGQDGKVLASGHGQPPPDVFKVTKGQQNSPLTAPRAGILTSGANYPGYRFSAGATGGKLTSDSSQGSAASTVTGADAKASRQGTITLPDGSQRSGVGEVPADFAALMADSKVLTTRRWSVTLPDGTQRSGEGEVPADIQALIRSDGQSWVRNQKIGPRTAESFHASQSAGQRRNPADAVTLLARASSHVNPTTTGPGSVNLPPVEVTSVRHWTVTLPDGSKRTGTGALPADLQALFDAQQRLTGQQQWQQLEERTSHVQVGSQAGPSVQRNWSVTAPNGTVRSGTGPIPSDLQALLEAQRAAGTLRSQARWSITSPDGTVQSGIGEIPADVQATLSRGPDRRWRVRMPDGRVRAGRGGLPADLAALMEGSIRSQRSVQAPPGELFYDVLGNCADSQSPSFQLTSSTQTVRLTLRTTAQKDGVTLTLPISPGLNDVEFVYNGKTLSGFSNGVQRTVSLSGPILPHQAPVLIGGCSVKGSGFRGEIDELSISSCIP